MANLKNSIITNQGLNAVHSFGLDGSNYTIRYFLPIYDPSIDDTIHSSSQSLTSGTGTDVKCPNPEVSVNKFVPEPDNIKLTVSAEIVFHVV